MRVEWEIVNPLSPEAVADLLASGVGASVTISMDNATPEAVAAVEQAAARSGVVLHRKENA